MSRTKATLIGFTAILMWAGLAPLSKASGDIPPFELTAVTFAIGGLMALLSWSWRPFVVNELACVIWPVWMISILSLFAYHFLYFTAIQHAPVIEVSLVAYLWPLLIVLFAGFLPGEHLQWHHLAGVSLGLCGAVIVMTQGQGFTLSHGLQSGHVLALLCAVIWALYSLASRYFGKVPTDAVAIFCLGTAALALICSLITEQWVWPAANTQWLAILGLGLFPLGSAFYAWDYGLKKGDVMVLGALSYAAPLLSTLLLLASGFTQAHWSITLACLLISAGGLLAAKDMLFKKGFLAESIIEQTDDSI